MTNDGHPRRAAVLALAAFALLLALPASVGAQVAATGPATAQAPKTIIDAAMALWAAGDYPSALAEFEKSIAADATNLTLHAKFAKAVAGGRYKRLEAMSERKRSEGEKARQAKADATGAAKDAEVKPASGYKPPPFKTDEELAKMDQSAAAAAKALDQLQATYARWMTERPSDAAYPYAAALLLERTDSAKKEGLLLKAAELAPAQTEPYTELVSLHSGYDDQAAVKYAKKALDIKPADTDLQLTYARSLWAADQTAARSYYDGLITRGAGTKAGAKALQRLISDVEDPAETGALVERFRRDYPNEWTPSYYPNNDLFAWYVERDPARGLAFAKDILAALEKPAAGGAPGQVPAEYLAKSWKANLEYAQAIVDARALIAAKKATEALARLEKVTLPSSVEDLPQLALVRAEAAASSGDVARAYEQLATELTTDINEAYQAAIVAYGAKLGKSTRQIDDDIWARRFARAETFKEFDLPRLGGQERVKLSDLRGKVVLVDFWFPG
jgi:hypothetical protein